MADGGARADENPAEAAVQALPAPESPPPTSETPLLDLPEPLPDPPPLPVPTPSLPLPPLPDTPELLSVETPPPPSTGLPLPTVPTLP